MPEETITKSRLSNLENKIAEEKNIRKKSCLKLVSLLPRPFYLIKDFRSYVTEISNAIFEIRYQSRRISELKKYLDLLKQK